jgi:hypothetical protein
MPRAEIATKQAKFTLEQLHAELSGKAQANKAEAKRLVLAMKQVEAVLKLLDPAYSCRGISVRRRRPNPWFKRGTVWRSVLDVLRAAEGSLTAREITDRMLATKEVQEPAPKAVRDLIGAVQASLRNHDGKDITAIGEGSPVRWQLFPIDVPEVVRKNPANGGIFQKSR